VDTNLTEYIILFRLAEQYLIRAEARARQGRIIGLNSAKSDLDIVRSRAGLAGTTARNQLDIIDAIMRERQLELFTEAGNRWLDIKRTDKIDEIMNTTAPLKGGIWASYKSLYPIPVIDIQRNRSLRGHQNPGYPEQ
jgi:hypothetical protein